MNGKVFIDANLLIYLYSSDEPAKQAAVSNIIARAPVVISLQIVNEFTNAMLRKRKATIDEISRSLQEIKKYTRIVSFTLNTIESAYKLLLNIVTRIMTL